jgi:putative transposase
MPRRKVILAEGEYYHIFNRGVEKRDIFRDKRDYSRFSETASYYQFSNLPTRFSFRGRPGIVKLSQLRSQENNKKLVDVIAYCLMPNHFHFLLKQNLKDGITIFIGKTGNSYARYFNIKHERVGPLFQGKFKAVRIMNNEELIHVSRYIHLNPLVDYLVKDLKEYSFSSYLEYLGLGKGISSPKEVMEQFETASDYEKFVQNQEDYARQLKRIERIVINH